MNSSVDNAVHGYQVTTTRISLDAVLVTTIRFFRFGGQVLLRFGIREPAEWLLNCVRPAPRVRSRSPEARLRLVPYVRPAPEEWR